MTEVAGSDGAGWLGSDGADSTPGEAASRPLQPRPRHVITELDCG